MSPEGCISARLCRVSSPERSAARHEAGAGGPARPFARRGTSRRSRSSQPIRPGASPVRSRASACTTRTCGPSGTYTPGYAQIGRPVKRRWERPPAAGTLVASTVAKWCGNSPTQRPATSGAGSPSGSHRHAGLSAALLARVHAALWEVSGLRVRRVGLRGGDSRPCTGVGRPRWPGSALQEHRDARRQPDHRDRPARQRAHSGRSDAQDLPRTGR